jgi:hypothetical protein
MTDGVDGIMQPMTASSRRPYEEDKTTDVGVTVRGLWIWFVLSMGTLTTWALSTAANFDGRWASTGLRLFSQILVVGGASYGVGALLGFLFGIPRTLNADIGRPVDDRVTHNGTRPNTNLEQVSDWLTKILVGVGLTQLKTLPEQLRSLGAYFAVADSPAVTLAVIVDWSVAGFLVGYLLTRLFFQGAFAHADEGIHESRGADHTAHRSLPPTAT